MIFGLKTPDHSIKTIYELFLKIGLVISFKKARLKEKDFGIEIIEFDPKTMKFLDEIPKKTETTDFSTKSDSVRNSTVKLPPLAPAKPLPLPDTKTALTKMQGVSEKPI